MGTHYIVLAHELNLAGRPPVVGDTQDAEFRWMSPSAIISSADVHPNIQVTSTLGTRSNESRRF
jgi:hypothetical protein